ncbi:uncharacterized protein LOC131627134 isoform X1 [Vicia villosa]|uniref:uncharacterized protein LOC131627134 isoform X1 n=1 Tax=Vicia villosa TaxID=3911 RepID=UPI00273BEBEA|nr:uncharacterized protein LOC131627134 isoform X1 [Vicia villosa]
MSMELDTLLPGVTQHPPPESYVEIDKRQKLEPEAEEESESQSNSESESESEWEPEPWSLKRIEDLVESDFYMYNDDSNPYLFSCSRFEYKNKAQIKKEEQVEKAVAEYEERSRNLTPFDAIPVPPLANIFGNNWPKPITITDDVRPLLIHLSNLALEIYNQVPNVSHSLPIYYSFIKLNILVLIFYSLFRVLQMQTMCLMKLSKQPLSLFLTALITLPLKQKMLLMLILSTALSQLFRPMYGTEGLKRDSL